jgi:DNA integrity scanning protein DisA with diadenylate cyclase activity
VFRQLDNFAELSRRQRLEMLSMDGATLIRQDGTIICAGAILRVPGGSVGGGRLAAAHAISAHGVGIKISQDGPVKAFVREEGVITQHFSMG